MNCIIVDDEKISRSVLKKLIEIDDTLVLAGECDSAQAAHKKMLTTQVDLIFLDINMPGINGMDFAKSLKNKSPLIIFTTAASEYAVDAFDLNVVDFLLKPIAPARFLKAVKKAKDIISIKGIEIQEGFRDHVFIRDSSTIRRLLIEDILYFEATGDYVRIHMKENSYMIHSSLKTIEKKLPNNVFVRVHRSYIINFTKIDTAEGKTLIISKNLIPVSANFTKNLNKKMNFL